jgi:hypothetical protein
MKARSQGEVRNEERVVAGQLQTSVKKPEIQ